jgi:hypothetical protein
MIIPVAKALYLCDGHIAFPNCKTDLMGIFNAIRPIQYPPVHGHFVVFAQLHSGLGQVPFYIDVRMAATGQLVGASNTHFLPSRGGIAWCSWLHHAKMSLSPVGCLSGRIVL